METGKSIQGQKELSENFCSIAHSLNDRLSGWEMKYRVSGYLETCSWEASRWRRTGHGNGLQGLRVGDLGFLFSFFNLPVRSLFENDNPVE